MKNNFFFIFTILLFSISVRGQAQIIMDKNNIEDIYQIGLVYSYDTAIVTGSMDIGKEIDSEQIFDFSSIAFNNGGSVERIDAPKNTPYDSLFPESQFVMYDSSVGQNNYAYYAVRDTGLFSIGGGVMINGHTVFTTAFKPPQIQLKIPLIYNTAWSFNVYDTVLGYIYDRDTGNSNVDAFGQLKINGNFYDCLRIKNELTITQKINGSTSYNKEIFYKYLTKNGLWIIVNIDTSDDGKSTVIPTSISYSELTETGVSNNTNVIPSQTSLSSVYPNPLGSMNNLTFSLTSRGNVSLSLVNSLGETVSTLTQGVYNAGTYNYQFSAEGLPDGVYYIVYQAGGVQQARLVVVAE